MSPGEVFELIKETFTKWKEDKASSHAAALAYYTTFSLAPLLVTVIALTALIWSREAVENQLLAQVGGLIGDEGAEFIREMLANAANPFTGTIASIAGLVVLLIGAMGVFVELKNALNAIWEVELKPVENLLQGAKRIIIDRFLSFAMILVIGFLLLVSLTLSAGLASFQEATQGFLGLPELVVQIVHFAISLGVISTLFALMFKFLPDAEIAWRDVWLGALVTAILFSAGKFGLGFYLGRSSIASNFGAAASLALILVWIYYSAQILFFGAEFTQMYANKFGSKIVPEEGAILIDKVKIPQESTQEAARQAETGATLTMVPSSPTVEPGLARPGSELDTAKRVDYGIKDSSLGTLDLTPQDVIMLAALFLGSLIISLFLSRKS